jgi:16S rRNA (adenine1518-N6/adenine1519-N6)-dimethyltransferase
VKAVAAGGRRGRVRWGQNFLVDASVAEAIVDWAGIEDRRVLEIGPGRGAITTLLATRASHLDLVEIDPELAGEWTRRYAGDDRVTVTCADVLDLDLTRLLTAPAHVVANLPFDAGTAIVSRLLDAPALVTELVVMLQKEVCQRLLAEPGGRSYGLLTIHSRLRADVDPGIEVPPECFRPAPKVVSQVVRLRPLGHLRHEVGDLALFERLLRAAFAARRKMLRNTLGAWLRGRLPDAAVHEHDVWRRSEIDPSARPETVSIEAWARLSCVVHEMLEEDAGAA